MTQQEAYQELRAKLEQIQTLTAETKALAKQHKLVLVHRYLDSPPETLDPKYLQPGSTYKLRDDLTPAEIKELKGLGFNDWYDDSAIQGADLYDVWVPSSLC